MRLIPLGTNGDFPSFGRQTMSILALDGENAPPFSDVPPEEALAVLGPPWFPRRLLDSPSVEVFSVSRKKWDLNWNSVRMRRQAHPGDSVGIRLAYCVDAAIDPGAMDFLAGAEVLLHEVWLTDEEEARESPERSGHSAAGPVATLAASAGVERLFPVHHHPKRTGPELEGLVRGMRREGITVELPREGEVLRLGKDPADA